MSVIQVTDLQAMRLDVLRFVSNDAAAAKEAIEFISDQLVRFELFKECYLIAHHEPTPVSKAIKAVEEAKQRLFLIE